MRENIGLYSEIIEYDGEEWEVQKLKPCPFCGGEAKIEFRGQYNEWRGGYIVARCRTCGASTKGTFYRGPEIEIPLEITVGGTNEAHQWNRRTL